MGISILSHFIKLINQNDTELIRVVLIVVKSLNDQQTDRLRKNFAQVFTKFGFKTEIKMNPTEADFFMSLLA